MKKFLIGVVALAIVVVAIGLLLPSGTHVERSIAIQAPPATVFAVVNGFRNFNRWSPWAELDPQARHAHTGPAQGVGAKMTWAGNAEYGTGSLEILESQPHRHVRSRLVFGEWEGTEVLTTFTIEPDGDGARVTWSFDADYGVDLMSRYFGLLMDGFIGADYEKGLMRLKGFAEGLPKADFTGLDIAPVEAKPVGVAFTSTSSALDGKAIGISLGVAYGKVQGFIHVRGLRQTAPPLAVYDEPKGGAVRFEAAIPVDRTDELPSSEVRLGTTFSGPAIRAVHKGSYAGLPAAHQAIRNYLAASGLEQDGSVIEQYMNSPGDVAEAELVTHIYYPVK